MPAKKPDSNPEISIIIVAYNSSEYLGRVFECLARQTYINFEIILIDNASKIEFRPKDEIASNARIFIQNEENIGFAKASNQGAKIAKGRWLAFLNPDAFAYENWLEQFMIAKEKYPHTKAFGSTQYLADNSNLLDGGGDNYSISGIAWRGGHNQSPPVFSIDYQIFSPCAAASFWEKTRFFELGGFEESFISYFEDVDLGFRHILQGGNAIQLIKAKVLHQASASSSRYSDYAVFHGTRNRLWTYVRNMPSEVFLLFLPIHIAATLLLWLQSALRGAGKAYFQGLWAGLGGLRQAFEARKKIQKKRSSSLGIILKAMSFSPFSLIFRKVIQKPIESE